MKKVRQLAHHFFYDVSFIKKIVFLFCIGIVVPMIFFAGSLVSGDGARHQGAYVKDRE